jgi:hypothetical protein
MDPDPESMNIVSGSPNAIMVHGSPYSKPSSENTDFMYNGIFFKKNLTYSPVSI